MPFSNLILHGAYANAAQKQDTWSEGTCWYFANSFLRASFSCLSARSRGSCSVRLCVADFVLLDADAFLPLLYNCTGQDL